jgi:uncharacterized membrane-anchored protein
MNSRKILLTAFIIVALVQLFVPAKMILDKENVLATGTEYKFRTAPIDPNDPFRGKYISLSYVEDTVVIPNEKGWVTGEIIYVSLATDKEGFAKIKSVSKEKPAGTQGFVKAKVSFITGDGSHKLAVDYPFNRYYMEESKAPDAEQTYRQSLQDTNRITYALVRIKNGDAVLKDVIIDGASIGKSKNKPLN